MGESKRRQYNRESFLREHVACAYCGAEATTTDHCPPRSFFTERKWPETFEFPACVSCNSASRLDEQALAALVRNKISRNLSAPEIEELGRLFRGIRNNQPELFLEWNGTTATQSKRVFRKAFGKSGDFLRFKGWNAINIGPLTTAAMDRFAIKLGKALY